ncbi:hypothetical protein BDV28DRAFT_153204 [Aspergillus coremiiformis]|uniref:Uncharacterized protein n=1 Tax=Aspergillus coremiiformis TaxID=138285 RepID=A0A5N6YWS5_9EURO|nr:hypothetical protein BDV28DRAFT_153204 [Aspergillus coremiiformis]
MAPAQKAIIAPPSPSLQVATPPESPPRDSPLWNADEGGRKQVLDAIRQVLIGEMPAPPPFDMNQLARFSEAVPDSTIRSSYDGPPNTPRTSHLESAPTVKAKDLMDLMVPSPNGPSTCAGWTSGATDHHLRDGAQTKTIPGSAPSDPVTMGQLKELFIILLELKLQPSVLLILVLRNIKNKVT